MRELKEFKHEYLMQCMLKVSNMSLLTDNK